MIKIEKGIPIPPRRRGVPIYPFKRMKINDSFVIPNDTRRNGLYHNAEQQGIKIRIVKINKNQLRVWRVK